MLNNELDSDFEIIEMYPTLEEYIKNNNLKIFKKDIQKFDIKKFNRNLYKVVFISWGTLILTRPIFEFTNINNLNKYYQNLDMNETDFLIKSCCEKEKIEYVNIFDEYNNIIKDISLFYKNDLKINNPIEAYICYTSMIKLGYFSDNYDYKYQVASNEVIGNYGINIIDGNGVCRNNASLLTDVMSSMGYDAYTICCNLINTNKPIDKETYIYNNHLLRKKTSILDFDINFDTKEIANHAVTVVKYNDKLYIFDPTNNSFFIEENHKYIRYDFTKIDIKENFQLEESLVLSYIYGIINQDELFKLGLDFKSGNVCTINDLDIKNIEYYYDKYYLIQTEQAQNIYDPFYNKEAVKIKKISYMFDIIEKEEN